MSQNVTLSSDVTSAQLRTIEALMKGSSVAAAAKSVGVSRETVSRWLHHDPAFIAELRNTRAECALQIRCSLEALGQSALATLREALQNSVVRPSRLRAAVAVLKMLGADRAEPLSSTTPEEVLAELRKREEEAQKSQPATPEQVASGNETVEEKSNGTAPKREAPAHDLLSEELPVPAARFDRVMMAACRDGHSIGLAELLRPAVTRAAQSARQSTRQARRGRGR